MFEEKPTVYKVWIDVEKISNFGEEDESYVDLDAEYGSALQTRDVDEAVCFASALQELAVELREERKGRSRVILMTKDIHGDDGITAPLRVALLNWFGNLTPFSTHVYNMQTESFFEGHYFKEFGPAVEDYLERCGRYDLDPRPTGTEVRDED